MRIEPIGLTRGELPTFVRATAQVSSPRWRGKPQVVWFEIPEQYASQVTSSATPWFQAALPMAMHLGETIESDVEVDSQWMTHACSAMTIWSRWFPQMKPVGIRAPSARAVRVAASPGRTALFFTAGVDSFYSLFRFDADAARTGSRPLDDLIYVCGYDIPLQNREALERKLSDLASIARKLNKNLVPIRTNLRETRFNELDWGTFMHGAGLGAAGLLMEPAWETLLLSAGGCIDDHTPWGSHPLTDPLMSTRRTRVFRHANNTTRFAKTEFVSKSDIAMQHLHVCWVRNSHDNCGECEKCIRTMVMLEIAGALSKAGCFPRVPILERLKTVTVTSGVAVPLWEDVKRQALERRRADIAHEIDLCLERSRSTMRATANPGLLRQLERNVRKVRKALLG